MAKSKPETQWSTLRLDLARRLHETLAQDLAVIGYQLDEIIGDANLGKKHRIALRKIRFSISQTTKSFRDQIYQLKLTSREQLSKQVVEILGEIKLAADFTYPEFDPKVEEALSQIILELARNTSRHSKATCFYLNFKENEESIEFEIGDDGIGGLKPKDFRFGLASIDELLIQSLLPTPAPQPVMAAVLNSRLVNLGAIMLKVLVVDDHTMVREGLRRLIARDEEICVIGEAGSKREAFAQISHLNPDVIVVDLNLPDGNGLEVVAWARSLSQRIGIVVLTMSNMPEHVLASMQSGASSHVDKASPSSELLSAIKASSVKPLSFTARKLTQAIDAKNREVGLTPRELEILEKLPTGDTVLEIAAQLFVTESTVKTHLASIYKKFGAKNRVQCINTARKTGLLP